MKLLVLVVPRESRDDVEAALQASGAVGFTEVPSVYGEGSSGPRFGSRVAPGISDLIFAALPEDRLAAVREAIGRVEKRRAGKLHAFLLPVTEAWE